MHYCPRCKRKTQSEDPKLARASNDRPYIIMRCASCGGKKSRFVSEQKAKQMAKQSGKKLPSGGFLQFIPLALSALQALG